MENYYLILLRRWCYFLIPAFFIKALIRHNLANSFFWIAVFLPTEFIFWVFISGYIFSLVFKLFKPYPEFMNFWESKIAKLVELPESVESAIQSYAMHIKRFALSALTAAQLGLINETAQWIFWRELVRMILFIFQQATFQSGNIRTSICIIWVNFFLALQMFNISILLILKSGSIFSLLLFIMSFFEFFTSLIDCLNSTFKLWQYYDELMKFFNRRR